jgi:hypothetical protein
LPAYRFVPGETPRPTRDPGGHSHLRDVQRPGAWRPEDWRKIEEWLWAIDLFNEEYWWESHEALESLWHAAGRTTAPARFVQALVHLSAACLNRRRGHRAAALRQAARSVQALRTARADGMTRSERASPLVMGIDLDRLIGDIERSFASTDALPIRIELHMEEA